MLRRFLVFSLMTLFITSSLYAAISVADPLQNKLNNEFIFVAKIESLDDTKPSMILTVQEDLKGKFAFRRLPVLLKGDEDAVKGDHVPQLLKRLQPNLPMVWIVSSRGKKHFAFTYTNGTWMQIIGTQVDKDRVNWQLAHGEPNLRQTYSKSTKELIVLIRDVLAGKAKAPPINDKEKPGFGPEIIIPKTSLPLPPGTYRALLPSEPSSENRQLGVIPSVVLMGPLAILALLFPALFGGVLILFRQWTAFITFFSVNSTLYLLHWWKGSVWLRNTWWNTPVGLWFVMTLVALVCTMWAWRRQLANLASGADALESPTRTEVLVLLLLSLCCVGFVIGTHYLAPAPSTDIVWNLTLVLTAGILGGLIYKIFRGFFEVMIPMATEGVMLGTALLGHLLVLTVFLAGSAASGPSASLEVGGGTTSSLSPQFFGTKWTYSTPESGIFVSNPVIFGDKVLAASAHPQFRGGTLFCLDLSSGSENWKFLDDGDMKQVFSTPGHADDKIFIGEGFHEDPRCKVYCLDANNGKKIWEHQTKSQTEASPVTNQGKTYIGCGNDGFFCFATDAQEKGEVLWQFPPADYEGRLLRFGAGACVENGKVFAATGVDRLQKDDPGETAFFCFDANTGMQEWKVPLPLPAWGAPVISKGQLFLAIGNGDVISDASEPAGALYCFDPTTGSQIWKLDLPNSVLQKPAVDEKAVYIGCRDGNCYGVDRKTGFLLWKQPLGSPVIGTPALAKSMQTGQTTSVFALSNKGKVVCLDPATGKPAWTSNISGQESQFFGALAVSVRAVAGAEARSILVGTGHLTAGTKATLLCLEDHLPVK